MQSRIVIKWFDTGEELCEENIAFMCNADRRFDLGEVVIVREDS